MDKPPLHKDWTITPGGDAKGGWMVEIHDGDRAETYSPKAENAEQAREAAIAVHTAKHFPEAGREASAQQAAMDAARASRAAEKAGNTDKIIPAGIVATLGETPVGAGAKALEKAGDAAPTPKPAPPP
jgi:hypothetical protein